MGAAVCAVLKRLEGHPGNYRSGANLIALVQSPAFLAMRLSDWHEALETSRGGELLRQFWFEVAVMLLEMQ